MIMKIHSKIRYVFSGLSMKPFRKNTVLSHTVLRTLYWAAHLQNPMGPNTGMQCLWAHDSRPWLYTHTPHTSSKHRLHARRATSCNCTQRQASVFNSSLDFHEIYHKSHAPLKSLRLGTQKSRQAKIQTLGQSVRYKLTAAASYFASGKYFMLQEKLLLFTPSLSLSHAHTQTHPKLTVQWC